MLGTDLPVLVDAEGLTILSQVKGLLPRSAPTLITPHAGELARLLGTDGASVEARRLEHARRAASELGVTVLLKGSTTIIAPPGASGGPVLVTRPVRRGWPLRVAVTCCPGWPARCSRRAWSPPRPLAAAYLHGLACARGGGPDRRARRGGTDSGERRRGADRGLRPGPGGTSRVPEPVSAMDRQALVDLGAITANVAALCQLVQGSQVMAVVKADGYGHGMVPAARAALAGGAAGWASST